MNNPDFIPVYDLNLIKGVNFEMSFQLALGTVNNDGTYTITGPLNLTGKTLRVIIEGIFRTDLILNSNAGATPAGSEIVVTDETDGQFNFKLTGTELEQMSKTDGKWRLFLLDGFNVDIIVYGAVLEVDLYAG